MKTLVKAALGAAILFTTATFADQFVANARVVKVVPLSADVTTEHNRCAMTKPGRSAGLAATLRWDVCRRATTASAERRGYRVYYRWDNRVYDRVMAEPPGDTLPVRVSLD